MKKSMKQILMALLAAAAMVGLDQYTKYLAVEKLSGRDPYVIIDGVLELLYTQNEGMAFSMMQKQQIFFYVMTAVIVCAITFLYLFRVPGDKKYLPINSILVMVVGGAVGNFIDRIRLRYVVDFIYFKLIDFPVFNVADIFITMSCIFFMLLLLFYYKEEDLKGII